MDLKRKDNLLKSDSAVAQADTEQPNPARSAGIPEKADGQTAFVKGEAASDEDAARSIAEKHGVDFIKLSEVNLLPHIVRLLQCAKRWGRRVCCQAI